MGTAVLSVPLTGELRGVPELRASPQKRPLDLPLHRSRTNQGLFHFPPQRGWERGSWGSDLSSGRLKLSYLKSFDFAQDAVL